MHVLPDNHRMHHGEDSGTPVVVLLHLFEVGKEADDLRRTVHKHLGEVGGEEGVELAAGQHPFQSFAFWYEFQVDIGG